MADTPWPIIPKSQDGAHEADKAESDWDTSEDAGVKWPDNVAELLPEVSYKGETQTFVITRPRIIPDTSWWRCQRAAEIYRRAARQRLSGEWAIRAAEVPTVELVTAPIVGTIESAPIADSVDVVQLDEDHDDDRP